jgi:hypothetical protein
VTRDHIQGEPVELVEDWTKLKAMDIVWLRPCNRCQKRHRFVLIKTHACAWWWEILPPANCQSKDAPNLVLDIQKATNNKHLGLVVNPPRVADDGETKVK